VRNELTDWQSFKTKEHLSRFDSAFKGEMRLRLKCCFHAAIARSIIGSLSAVPWCYDEETLAELIGKSKGTLSHLKTPGRSDDGAPAYLALRLLWKSEIEKQVDAQTTRAVLHLFRYACVQFFERLGIHAFCRLMTGEPPPTATSDLLSMRQLKWIQEAVFVYGWHPGDNTSISLETMRIRYPDAGTSDQQSLLSVTTKFGLPALLFYHLASGAKFDDQI
jgi:hypothetical protein